MRNRITFFLHFRAAGCDGGRIGMMLWALEGGANTGLLVTAGIWVISSRQLQQAYVLLV